MWLPDDFVLYDEGDGCYDITVNGRVYHYGSKMINYQRVCRIAGKNQWKRQADVTWYAKEENRGGMLGFDDEIEAESGLVFNAHYTDNA